ncbi:MAG: GatB/YqeY domain-containing protein [Acidimicrobiia bacterium]|nr:MAG: GatB/YqeY domain-containing protein [Acidimicrobiia bacterium]
MSIESQLKDDQKTAMRARDKATLNAIRSVQAEVATAKSAPGFKGEIDDDLFRKTIATYVKRISKSLDEYKSMGERGEEHVKILSFEVDYLQGYLPKSLDEETTRALIEDVLAGLDSGADPQAGQVIGAVMRSGKDLDGALVNRIVREILDS